MIIPADQLIIVRLGSWASRGASGLGCRRAMTSSAYRLCSSDSNGALWKKRRSSTLTPGSTCPGNGVHKRTFSPPHIAQRCAASSGSTTGKPVTRPSGPTEEPSVPSQ